MTHILRISFYLELYFLSDLTARKILADFNQDCISLQ